MAKVFWHNLETKEIEKIQRTDFKNGLTEKEVKIRQKEFGFNEIPEKEPLTKLAIFLNQFKSVLILILIFAGVLVLLLRHFADALAIFLIVLLNAIIGFFQDYKAIKIFEELKKILKIEARIIREGREKIVDAKELVPADIVVLSPGDKVPADGRIFESQNLRVNEAVLTGEFLSSLKYSRVLPEETNLADRENMVYMGTTVEDGKGKMIATETGKSTEIGRITQEIREEEKITPLQKKIKRLGIEIAVLISFLIFIVFVLGLRREKNFILLFETSVSLAVSAVPEGLPIAITVALALGAQRILKKQGLIRNLASVETLGVCSVILADKTLTLTEGKMEVAEIIGEKPLVLKVAALTVDAFVENPQDPKEKWIIRGRPLEKAILKKAAEEGIEKHKFEKNKILEIPFDSVKKFSGAIYKEDGKKFLYFCAAPERLLEITNLSDIGKRKWQEKLEGFGKKGLRVVGVAKREISDEREFENLIKEGNFQFLGLIAFKDPIRKGAKEAIEICKRAGMKPIIISGDHKMTVKAVAEELGIKIGRENILEGNEIDKLSDEELEKILPKIKIYARTEPKHKLRIAKAWQRMGKIVAMTGDGVNDSPVLRAADIGVALGSGTEVAKEASDLVLLNDNFSVIEEAIREGRIVMDNAKKTILFMCAECFSEIILVLGAFLLNLPLPILPVQILWQNLIEGSPQGMTFAFEPEEKGIMERKPDDPKLPILTREIKCLIFFAGVITDIILLFLFILLLNEFYLPIEKLRTFCFAGLAFGSFCYAFSCKNVRRNIWEYNPFSNKYLNISLSLGFLILLAAIYFSPLQFLLKTVPLGFFEWLILGFFGVLDLIIFELIKYFLKK